MSIYGLQELIHPVSVPEFFNTYWNKKSLYIPGSPEKIKGLFSWKEINRIVREHRLQPSQIRLSHERKSSDDLAFLRQRQTSRGATIYFIDIPLFYELLREGASLVLDAVDEMSEPVTDFCTHLARDFATQLSVNAYGTWKNVPGFGTHWDDHDLFIVQIDGHKHWQLFGATRLFPLEKDVEKNPFPDVSKLEWEATIKPGDVIYIPRGHWHCATGVNEPTLHLTCGMNNPTGVDFLDWVVNMLRKEQIVRTDVPRFSSERQKESYANELKATIDAFFQDNAVENFSRYWKARNQARTYLSLPFIASEPLLPASDNFNIKMSSISYDGFYNLPDGNVSFRCVGKEIKIAGEARTTLVEILSGRKILVANLIKMAPSELHRDAVRKIIEVLLVHGVIHIEE
jgi:ribosomal protein L16 Arg81 hydroxylase